MTNLAPWGSPSPQPAAAPPPPDLTPSRPTYDGRLGELYAIYLRHLVLMIVTLGWSRFWGRTRLRRYAADIDDDLAYPFFIFLNDGDLLAGGLTLSHVRRGVAQTGTLGYWIGEPFANQGLMSEAVRLVLDFAFTRLGLHRVEAACLPINTPSIRLLRKSGFTEEGFARRYLRIAGEWQDHLLFAIIAGDRIPPYTAQGRG